MSVPRISGVQLSDPSAGPLLLLGTSIGTSASALWSASAALLGERFHVVAWDLPGHGGNTEPVSAGFTMTELAAGVLAAAVYCGVPDANTAFRIAQAVLADEETRPEEDDR